MRTSKKIYYEFNDELLAKEEIRISIYPLSAPPDDYMYYLNMYHTTAYMTSSRTATFLRDNNVRKLELSISITEQYESKHIKRARYYHYPPSEQHMKRRIMELVSVLGTVRRIRKLIVEVG